MRNKETESELNPSGIEEIGRTDFTSIENFYLFLEKTGIDREPETDEEKALDNAHDRQAEFILSNTEGSGQDCHIFMVKEKGEIIAGIELRIGHFGSEKKQAFMCNQAVAPAYRRMGYATQLNRRTLEAGKMNGCARAFAFVKQNKEAVIELMNNLGYVISHREPPKGFLRKEDELFLERDLTT